MHPASSRPRQLSRRVTASALAAATALALASCGGPSHTGDAAADPAAALPASTSGYVALSLKPASAARAQADALARSLLGAPDAAAALRNLFDRNAGGLRYARDVQPWVGDRAALALVPGPGGRGDGLLAAASRDDARARSTLGDSPALPRSSRFEKVDLYASADGARSAALVGHVVLLGAPSAVRAAIAAVHAKRTLAASATYRTAVARTRDGVPALVYADAGPLARAALGGSGQSGLPAQLLGALATQIGPVAGTVTAQQDAIRIDAAAAPSSAIGATAGPAATAALAGVPGDAWLALGIADVGTTAKQLLAGLDAQGGAGIGAIVGQLGSALGLNVDRDIFGWMGPGAIFVRGRGSDLGGALITESTDVAATKRLLAKLRFGLGFLLDGVHALKQPGVDSGIAVTLNGTKIFGALSGTRFVLAIGAPALRQALHPTTRLDASAGYRRSIRLLGGTRPSFYADIPKAIPLLQKSGPTTTTSSTTTQLLTKLSQLTIATTKTPTSSKATLILTTKH